MKADIFFVLDASATIEPPDFEKALKFEEEFVTGLTIGPDDDRVGTITFGDCAQIEFNVSTYSRKSDLITAIRSITQVRGGTHMADGLCKLNQSLVEARHSDTVLRIAIVMSDGRSNLNDKSNDCSWTTTKAAAEIHKLKPPVLVYVVGVSDGVDDEELKAISTSDSYIHIDNFTKIQLLADHYVDDICTKGKRLIMNHSLYTAMHNHQCETKVPKPCLHFIVPINYSELRNKSSNPFSRVIATIARLNSAGYLRTPGNSPAKVSVPGDCSNSGLPQPSSPMPGLRLAYTIALEPRNSTSMRV